MYEIINLITLGNLVILSIILFFVKSNLKQANVFLALLLLCLASNMIDYIIWNNQLFKNYIWFITFGYVSTALIGPLFYYYTLSMLGKRIKLLNTSKLIHSIPLIIAISYYLYFQLQSKEEKLEYIYSAYNSYPVIESCLNIFFALILIGFLFYSYYEVVKHNKRLKDCLSNMEKINVNWLKNFIISIGISFSLLVILLIAVNNQIYNEIGGQLFLTFFYLYVFIKTIKHPAIYNAYDDTIYDSIELEFSDKDISKGKKISDKEIDNLYSDLIFQLEENRLYQIPKLTLKELASTLNIHPHVLSYIINNKTDSNFYTLINTYRVEETKKQLLNPDNSNLTIEAIGLQSGFNSATSFFDVFRKITGTTPTKYRKNKE